MHLWKKGMGEMASYHLMTFDLITFEVYMITFSIKMPLGHNLQHFPPDSR